MRLGYMVPEYPGQTHVLFKRELEALKAAGVEVSTVTTRFPPAERRPHAWADEAVAETTALYPFSVREAWHAAVHIFNAGPRSWTRLGVELVRTERRGRERVDQLAAVLLGARLARQARREAWDHIHVHSCRSSADIARFARLLGGPPYSLMLHSPLGDYGPDQASKWAGASCGLVITEALRDELRETVGRASPRRLAVVGMTGGIARFARTTPYRPWDGVEPARVVSVGRLNPAKGHLHLIGAVAVLRRQGLPIQLTIAGEDDDSGAGYRRVLEDELHRLELTDTVSLPGARPEEEIVRRLHDAHVFALASMSEPLGVAILEAQAAGVPVVSTRAGGVPTIVTDGTSGLLVPPSAPTELAGVIERVLTEPALAERLSRGGERAAFAVAERPDSAAVLLDLLGFAPSAHANGQPVRQA